MVRDDCIFCKIANGVIPAAALYEDDDFKVPKQHYQDLCELDEAVGTRVLGLAAKLGKAMKSGLGCAGFNLVQNNGEAAGQTVKHFHMHIIPRYEGGPEMVAWKPGSVDPEEAEQIVEEVTARM